MGVFQYLFYIRLIYRLIKKKKILPIHRGGRCKQKPSVTASSVSLESHLQPGTDKEKTQKDVSFNQKSYWSIEKREKVILKDKQQHIQTKKIHGV